jgi:small GTP-binding protein
LWDTAGQERYKSIAKIYYQKSDAIIFVYDITNLESFNSVKTLYNEVKQTVDLNKVITFIVGNKNDMYAQEAVKKDVAEEYAKSIGGGYRCVSALKSTGINELFDYVALSLLKNEGRETIIENSGNDKNNNKKEFTLKKEEKKGEKQKKKCC